ncbi:MAG: phosphonate ABC transporter ATP-binding protein [Rubrivivax sp.]|jgi:phosphonate transport system ATP-binding protein|nr:phosphonate ABC transporter ATP-binding protein [Rubrivivax sp.]
MSLSAPAAVDIVRVSKQFGRQAWALKAVSASIQPGERVALIGASGSGKSTLLRCISGLERVDATGGRITLFGQTLQEDGRLSPDVRQLRRQLGVIFQQFNLVGRLPLITNVLAGLAPSLPLWQALSGRFSQAQRLQAFDMLERVGLGPQAFQRASTLSGGQQQRAAVARSLMQGPRLLLADEPVASLDPASTHRVMELLSLLNRERGITLVASLHHVELARRYFDRALALRHGELVFDGPTHALTDDLLHRLYGTQAESLNAPEGEWPSPTMNPLTTHEEIAA